MIDHDHWRNAFPESRHAERVDRVWKELAPMLRAQQSLRAKKPSRLVPLLAAAFASAAVILFFLLRPTAVSKILTTDRGLPLSQEIFDPNTTVRKFSDGSILTVRKGTALFLSENSEKTVRFSLEQGRAHFNIEPGGPRQWRVDVGMLYITVLGTVFTVEKDDSLVTVSVERGVVSVHGENVRQGGEKLVAGQSVHLALKEAGQLPSELEPKETQLQDTEAPDSAPKKQRAEQSMWKIHATAGNYTEAFAELGPSGVAEAARKSNKTDELFQLADVARFSGHPAEAESPLLQILNTAGPSEAGMAAYTLGRLYLGQISHPDKAVTMFEKALSLELPEALRETALINLTDALRRLGNSEWADSASAYLDQYPNGRYRKQAEGWLMNAAHKP